MTTTESINNNESIYSNEPIDNTLNTAGYSEVSYNTMMKCFTGNVPEKALAPLSHRYVNSLTEEQLEEIEDIKSKIDIFSDDINLYAKEAQAQMCNYSSSILSNSITAKMGDAGEALTSAMLAIRDNGVIEEDANIITKLINKFRKHSITLEIKGKNLQENIESLKSTLLANASELDMLSSTYRSMYNDNIVSNSYLNKFIYAGELKLEEEIKTYEKLLSEVQSNGEDIVEQMHVADYKARIDEFARRIDDLKCTKYLTIVQVPETSFIIYNSRELASKLRSIAINIGPFLSTQFAIAIGNQKLADTVTRIDMVNTGINSLMVANAKSTAELTPAIIGSIENPIINNSTIDQIGTYLTTALETSFSIKENAIKARIDCQKKREEAEEVIRAAIEKNHGTISLLKESLETN